MKSFRTEIKIKPSQKQFDHQSSILTLGSCFSDQVGRLLKRFKFSSSSNPLGIAFNPLAILAQLQLSESDADLNDAHIVEYDEQFFHLFGHSSIRSAHRDDLKKKVLTASRSLEHSLLKADLISITWGTAFAYIHGETQSVVANCHKQDSSLFRKDLLEPNVIIEAYSKLFKKHPDKNFLLTVSPVRHLKDTLELNSVSKGILRYASHTLSQTFENVEYFASYEVLMDDLRDYRFYKDDMLHPSDEAIQYIWKLFEDFAFSSETRAVNRNWEKVLRSLEHRPFNPDGASHKDFLRKLLSNITSFPFSVDTEIEELKKVIDA